MKQITFLTIHPEFIEAYFRFGVFASALRKKIVELQAVQLRDFALDKHSSVDAPPFGGGDGMIMRADVLSRGVLSSFEKMRENGTPRVVFACPKGKKFNQKVAEDLALDPAPLLFVNGRFGGVDQRFIDRHVTDRVSLGDFVISGGELASLAVADSVLRLLPGVLGNEQSAVVDSFSKNLNRGLEFPQYTKPVEFDGLKVPDVLRSGNHEAIRKWRSEQAEEETRYLRPDLLE